MRDVHKDIRSLDSGLGQARAGPGHGFVHDALTDGSKRVRRETEEFLQEGVSGCGAYFCRICERSISVDEAENEFCLCMTICTTCKGTFSRCEACSDQIKLVAEEYAEFVAAGGEEE